MTSKSGTLPPQELCDFIVESLDSDKAENIEILKMDANTALTDYMIVASGQSSRQVVRLVEKLIERLRARGYRNIAVEGMEQGDWVIADFGDSIVHVFRPEVREFYSIEKIWNHHHDLDRHSSDVDHQ